ncbi:MAG: NUDIX domain-containing protein [Flavobacteriales bacterium]
MTAIDHFNIRVYGLLLNDGNVLVTDETMSGQQITKFPGGGLEFGEGPVDCLVRELREELGVEAMDLQHFYTTSFFQRSAYRKNEQIISIYYTFQLRELAELVVSDLPFGKHADDRIWCRWLPVTADGLEQVTLPIDRKVFDLLVANNF